MEVLPAFIIFLCLYFPELHHSPATTYASTEYRGNLNDGKGRENKWVCIRNATIVLMKESSFYSFPLISL